MFIKTAGFLVGLAAVGGLAYHYGQSGALPQPLQQILPAAWFEVSDAGERLVEAVLEQVPQDAGVEATPVTVVSADAPQLPAATVERLVEAATPSTSWSPVWRPFFSERAARGFADHVAAATGLELRISADSVLGEYRVEVAHTSEQERAVAGELIMAATGYQIDRVTP